MRNKVIFVRNLSQNISKAKFNYHFIQHIDLFKSIKNWEMKYSFRKLRAKILESFDYFEYLNSISFHPPVMIITTLVFFYIRRKILLAGKKY